MIGLAGDLMLESGSKGPKKRFQQLVTRLSKLKNLPIGNIFLEN
jgi:flagellar motor protein MotB